MNATRRDLEIQFRRVVQNGWLPWFQREAKRAGTTTSHLLGLGSRETNLQNIRGDFRNGHYNGFGVLQVDIGTDPAYARAWPPANVEPSIVRGVDIYLSKVRDTKHSVGNRVHVRSRFFVGKAVDAEDLRRVSTAAYNCGRWAHYHFSKGQNVDSTTTGDDYSRDVYDRAVVFADILEERGYEKMAVHRELSLQGKYARKSDREMYGFYGAAERVHLPAGEPQEAAEELAAVDYERDTTDNNPFLISDDNIDLFADSTADNGDPAGSIGNPQLVPSPITVESPDPEADGSPAASGDGELSQTITQTVETTEGTRTDETTLTPPAGDAPNVEPSFFMQVTDWKPWAVRWASRIWKGVGGLNIGQGTTLTLAAIKDPSNWYIYAIIGVVLFLLLVGVAIFACLVVGGIYMFQNRGIPALKQKQLEILADPNMKNVGLNFIKK